MSDAADTPLFPPEEICAQAQGNAAAWILTIIAYLKEWGSPVEDCIAYHGRSFAPAWEELRDRPVEEVAQLVALNALSVGATLRSLSSEEGRAEMLVEGCGRTKSSWASCRSIGMSATRYGTPTGQLWSTWASATLGSVRTT